MNTNLNDLIGLAEEEAQKLLERLDPGYTVKVDALGGTKIFNEVGDIEAHIKPEKV